MLSFGQLRAWHQQLAQLPEADLTPATSLLFSSPKVLEKEWRHVVVAGRVVASVRYLWQGELRVSVADVPPALLAFVAECLACYQPHEVVVLDTALAAGKYVIIECNCFNCTGFYHTDVTASIAAVTEWRAAAGN
ncbi:MAG: ATP-grasp domain-containing protein [Janthinobacterium lividum]